MGDDGNVELMSPLPTDARPTLAILCDIVLQRCNDAIATVRSKAVESLATLVQAHGTGQFAVKLLPMTLRRCDDDRPAVRKAAVTLLQAIAAVGDAGASAVLLLSHMLTVIPLSIGAFCRRDGV